VVKQVTGVRLTERQKNCPSLSPGRGEAGHLDMTELTTHSLTRLT